MLTPFLSLPHSGLTPAGPRSKASTAPQYEDFPASLRVVLESQALKQSGTPDESRIPKSSKVAFSSIRRGLDKELPEIEANQSSGGLPQPSTFSSTDGFWRKIRASTRPKDSMDASRSNSRCESRATIRRACDEADEVGSGKQSKWWNRIRDNAAKIVGQTAASSRPTTIHMQRPSITTDEDQSRYKGSLDAAMTLADGFRGYPADTTTTDCDGE